MYEVYTDGSCRGNGKEGAVGGWAYVVLKDGEILFKDSGAETSTTNQRMELTAAVRACEKIADHDAYAVVKIYSDSAYLINCKNQKWYVNWQKNGWVNSKKQPVANPDLWRELIPYFDNPTQFQFIKVKGHAGDKWNEVVDDMAVAAAEELRNG